MPSYSVACSVGLSEEAAIQLEAEARRIGVSKQSLASRIILAALDRGSEE